MENRNINVRFILRMVITYLFLVFCSVVVLFPFYWMIITSLKTNAVYQSESIPSLFVKNPTVANYINAWKPTLNYNLGRSVFNTVIYAFTTTFLMMVVSTLAAYGFSRLNFKGKDILFTVFLAMMMVPNELLMVTNYQTAMSLKLGNTFTGLIVPSVLSVFYIYLLRQNFMQVPDSVYFAAKVDHASDFKYLIKILIPLSKPTMISIFILKLIECWNSYVWPSLVADETNYQVISVAIEAIKNSSDGRADVPRMMAAVVCVSLPLLITYIIFRRQIMSGVSRTGAKG